MLTRSALLSTCEQAVFATRSRQAIAAHRHCSAPLALSWKHRDTQLREFDWEGLSSRARFDGPCLHLAPAVHAPVTVVRARLRGAGGDAAYVVQVVDEARSQLLLITAMTKLAAHAPSTAPHLTGHKPAIASPHGGRHGGRRGGGECGRGWRATARDSGGSGSARGGGGGAADWPPTGGGLLCGAAALSSGCVTALLLCRNSGWGIGKGAALSTGFG